MTSAEAHYPFWLWHLTDNHALEELHYVLQLGLVNIPSAQWKFFILQLFIRLNLPVLFVKQRIIIWNTDPDYNIL